MNGFYALRYFKGLSLFAMTLSASSAENVFEDQNKDLNINSKSFLHSPSERPDLPRLAQEQIQHRFFF
jgi:hypothetical protein